MAAFGNDITSTDEFREADIVHLHWVNQGMLSLRNIRDILKSGKPVVWTMHDMWPCTGICHHARQCVGFHSQCADCMYLRFPGKRDLSASTFHFKQNIYSAGRINFVACSKWLLKEAEKSALTVGHNIMDIPNPIDTAVFCKGDMAKARQALNLPADKHIILFCCVKITDERKGFRQFVECSNVLKQNGVDVVVAVMGANSEQLCSLLPFETYQLGYIKGEKEAARVYNAVDLFVTPSLEENLPNTIMEALACGTPCVGFNVGGIPEMIDHEKNGYVAQYRDAADMAHGIEWCLDDTNYDGLSAEAVYKVHRCYSQDVVASQYVKLYNELLHNEE